jgi:hypothetical protein
MDPIVIPVLATLASLAVRGIALAGLLAQLRWRERQQREHGAYIAALARALPRGCQLDEVRADGSTLHLVITPAVTLTERPSQ